MAGTITISAEAALEDELYLVRELDGVLRRVQAELYRRVERARELAASVEGVHEGSTAVERELAARSFRAEIATMLVVHESTAARLIDEASRLTGPRSATLDALDRCELNLAQVRSVLELSAGLDPDAAAALEAVAISHAPGRTNGQLRRKLHRERERLVAEPLGTRRARAAAARRVCVEPAPDGMAWLSILLEAEKAMAVAARLGGIAASPDAADPRTRAQREADVAADLLLVGVLDGDDRTRWAAAATGAVAPRISVTVPAMTLLGLGDEPADLAGYGPIDADTARRLAGHAPSVRRILVHPETGAVLSYGRDTYRAPADLAGYVKYRDGRCRFPGCDRRADHTDLDHTVAWQHGGRTDAGNLAVLCRRHHRLKHESRWRVEHEPGGVMKWTSPAGHELRTFPERPFIAVGRETAMRVGPRAPAAPEPPPRSADQTTDAPPF
ncbi:HNH endonuclease signature motif containing protein [Agromyces larvae]|uniref:HNH endonuclease n=1 Tax=Agromyces larvae TaxID=2929802 RepID=A0ABY4C003_9MICO|nr:HNH endonuclease signature motif containing protein [Agromyces larvae]UOE44704.1 HNH endonuclease [Agromyces larvae]